MDLKLKDNSKLKFAPFTQLEYIVSTGTQWIDTCISFPNGFRSVAKLYPTDVSSYKAYAGAFQQNLHNIHRIYNGSWNPCTKNNNNSCYGTVSANTLYTVDMSNANSKYNLIVNGSTLANDVTTPTGYSSLTCWLFAIHRTDNTNYQYYYGRIYEVSLYDENNVLKFHGIPAIDFSNVVCLYDTVSETFFYNQGTGNFIAGPVVKPVLPDNILLKTTSLYHENTSNVNGLLLLSSILNAQETAEDVVLNRIRVDIGNISGSLNTLLKFATFSGFDDNYEPQAKPRFVGTWTVNDWYTTAQLQEAQQAFDGLTIIGDPNFLVDFSQLAVQVLDNTQPNYNPAFAIVLQSAGYGSTLDYPLIPGQTGRWLLTKTQASIITTLQIKGITTVTDTNSIVSSDTTATYDFESMLEFKYFGITRFPASFLQSCSKLKKIVLPTSVTSFNEQGFAIYGSNIFVKVQSFINDINGWYFMSGAKAIHFTQNTPPSSHTSPYLEFYNSPSPAGAYIGSGSKKQCAKALEDWSDFNFTNGLKYNWYEYAAPKITYDGTDVTMTVQRTSTIYYTTDGSTPTEQSTKYTQPFAWNGQGVIKAMAIDETLIIGDIQYADDFYAQTCANPVITADSTNNQITISCATSGAAIHYTTDGSYPTLDSPIYSAPITSQEDIVKVRCFATATGYNDSEVVNKICVMDDSLWGTDGDTSTFAIQCIDSTKPNYNPEACVVFESNSKLIGYEKAGAYMTKTDALTITSIGNITSLVDSRNYLIPGTTLGSMLYFNELRYFGIGTIGSHYLTKCKLLWFPNRSCTAVLGETIVNMIIKYYHGNLNLRYMRRACEELYFYGTWNEWCAQSFNDGLYSEWENPAYDCPKVYFNDELVQFAELPANITSIGNHTFTHFTCLQYVHLLAVTPPTLGTNPFNATSFKIYVGDGSSASHDDAILADYVAASGWSSYASRLDTWYNYLHP